MDKLAERTIQIDSKTCVVSASLAAIIGMTRQRVDQLAKEGVFAKNDAGKYPLAENVRRWIAYKTSSSNGEAKFNDERNVHEKIKRETAELKLARLRNEVHNAKDIELMVGGMLTVFKRRMLSIPHKMAMMLAGKSEEDVDEILSAEIEAALMELSQFDASKLSEAGYDDSEDD